MTKFFIFSPFQDFTVSQFTGFFCIRTTLLCFANIEIGKSSVIPGIGIGGFQADSFVEIVDGLFVQTSLV